MNGFIHGEGVYSWPDDKSYTGNYHFNKKEGWGMMFWNNSGISYEGSWSDGKQNGWGIVKMNGDVVFEGRFLDGRREGAPKTEQVQNSNYNNNNEAETYF